MTVYPPLKSPLKNYNLSASSRSVHTLPIFPYWSCLVEDELFDHSRTQFDQPTAFWRANTQKTAALSGTHPLTFSTRCYCSLLFSQTSGALSAVTKAVLKTCDFQLLFQRMCQDKAGRGNFCFRHGEEREGVLSFSKVRSGSQTINFT